MGGCLDVGFAAVVAAAAAGEEGAEEDGGALAVECAQRDIADSKVVCEEVEGEEEEECAPYCDGGCDVRD